MSPETEAMAIDILAEEQGFTAEDFAEWWRESEAEARREADAARNGWGW